MKYLDTNNWTVNRYWCNCHDQCCNLEISMEKFNDCRDDALITISINNYPSNFWQRIKDAFKLIFTKRLCYKEVVINSKEAKEISEFLK